MVDTSADRNGEGEPEVLLQPPVGNTWPIIMGVDPGTRVLGYGMVVVAPSGPRLLTAGVLRVGQRQAISERLGNIRESIDELIRRFQPSVLAIETAFAAQNVRSALRIGEGRGVVMACGGLLGLEVHEYSPMEIKKAVTGSGAASKEQVAALVARTLGSDDLGLGLDATDALAAALTHVFRARADAIVRGGPAPGRTTSTPKPPSFGASPK